MRLIIVGSPGAGKTTISKILAKHLNLHHIECDKFFWQGLDVVSSVENEIQGENWIVDGHLSKIHHLVFPLVDKVIVIEGLNLLNLVRSLKRDWRNPSKFWFNIQNYEKMAKRRMELINEFQKTRLHDVVTLNNFPNLSESNLASLCESIKSSSVEPRKKTIKSQRPRKIKKDESHSNGSH